MYRSTVPKFPLPRFRTSRRLRRGTSKRPVPSVSSSSFVTTCEGWRDGEDETRIHGNEVHPE